MLARSLTVPALALSFALAIACTQNTEPAPAPKPQGSKGLLSAAALAELRTPGAWVATPFLDGALTVALPPTLRRAPLPGVPPGSKLEAASVVSMRNDSDTLSFVVNRGGHLREADVGAVCSSMSTADMGGTGDIIAREMLTTHATPICKLHSVSSGYLTMQRLISIEGRGTHIAVTLANGNDDATKQAAEKILGTIQLKLTAEGSPCAAGTAAKCADDRRMLSCKDGRWTVLYCNAACEAHGGPGDGCVWDTGRNAPLCMCNDTPR